MTNEEQNAISASLLVLANATEMMMTAWLNMGNAYLTGESKMLYNGMRDGVKKARFYYERFTDKVATVLYDEDKDVERLDDIRQNGAFIARLLLHTLNLNNNGMTDDDIEKELNGLLDKMESPEMFISQEVINKFVIR